MTPPAPLDPWDRLVAAARRAPALEPATLPAGFSTRVAALGLAATERPTIGRLLDVFSWRALAVAACAVLLTSTATLPGVIASASADDAAITAEFVDPLTAFLDLS